MDTLTGASGMGLQLLFLGLSFILIAIMATISDVIIKTFSDIDYITKKKAFFIAFLNALFFCWQTDFIIFEYMLEDSFRWHPVGWIYTSVLVAGGSSLIRDKFSLIDAIPTFVMKLAGANTTGRVGSSPLSDSDSSSSEDESTSCKDKEEDSPEEYEYSEEPGEPKI